MGQIVGKKHGFFQEPVPKIENGSQPQVCTQRSSVALQTAGLIWSDQAGLLLWALQVIQTHCAPG